MEIYNPVAIANYFLRKAWNEQSRGLTQMQLHKLVYIAHGWGLATTGQPLLNRSVEAWKHGPVIPSLYHSLKHYGSEPITEPIEPEDDLFSLFGTELNELDPNDQEVSTLLDWVWESYGHLTGGQLRALTHAEGTPWYTTWHDRWGSIVRGTDIAVDLIRTHFVELWQKRGESVVS